MTPWIDVLSPAIVIAVVVLLWGADTATATHQSTERPRVPAPAGTQESALMAQDEGTVVMADHEAIERLREMR